MRTTIPDRTPSGGMRESDRGFISDGNSSTATIANGASFTGEWEDYRGFSDVVIAVKTDVDGYYDLQFSPDGTNVDSSLRRQYKTTPSGRIEPPHRFTITRRFFRVVFTNDSGGAQSHFRMQTLVGSKSDLNAPGDSTLSQDFDAISTRPSDFRYEVAEGVRQGYTTWNKWGYNSDIDTASAETVWSVGGALAAMTSADTLNVVSSSTADDGDPAGTGAQSIIIYGIDANYLAQTEVVTLDGTTPVTTSNTWLGVNRAAIYLSGSGGVNAGTISITQTTGGSNQAEIPTGEGSTQHAFFFVQAGHQALMDWLLINAVKTSGGAQPILTTRVWVTSLVSGSRYEVFRHLMDTALNDTEDIRPSQPFVVGEKSLIEVEAETNQNNTAVSIRFSLIEGRVNGT